MKSLKVKNMQVKISKDNIGNLKNRDINTQKNHLKNK